MSGQSYEVEVITKRTGSGFRSLRDAVKWAQDRARSCDSWAVTTTVKGEKRVVREG